MQILMYLQSCLTTEPYWTDMSTMNNKYFDIRIENNIPCESKKQRKYLKNLFKTNFPALKFTPRPDKRKSEVLQHKEGLGAAVDFFASRTSGARSESMEIYFVASLLRQELRQYKDKWKYSGKLTAEYHRPPLLSFLLQSMLFGQHAPRLQVRIELEKSTILSMTLGKFFCKTSQRTGKLNIHH